MHDIFSRSWWAAALERSGAQAAESLLILITAGVVIDSEFLWAALGVGLGGAFVSLLMSVFSLPETTDAGRPRWRAIFFRIIRTVVAVTLAVIGTDAFNVFEFDWGTALITIAATTAIAFVKLLARVPAESIDVVYVPRR